MNAMLSKYSSYICKNERSIIASKELYKGFTDKFIQDSSIEEKSSKAST